MRPSNAVEDSATPGPEILDSQVSPQHNESGFFMRELEFLCVVREN